MIHTDRSRPIDPAPLLPARRGESAGLKLALLGVAGASIEWYDFFLYAAASALVFPSVFFPATLPPFVALIASFSTFAVGFIARPIGAVLFGHMGDRVGRNRSLATALIVMGGATTLIGLMPSYHSIGVFAPLLLVLLRLLQGLAVGGQWGGAMLLATENAPRSRRGLYGSIVQSGVPLGVVLANLALLAANGATSPAAFMAYGWRIPFLLSFVLVGLGLFVRYRIEDTVVFRQVQQCEPPEAPTARSPVLEALRLHPKLILLAAGAFCSNPLTFYIQITYIVAYATRAEGMHLPRSTVLAAVLIASVVSVPMTFAAGRLSDRYGRRALIMAGIALSGLWGFILFPLIDTRSFRWITAAVCIAGLVNSLSYGPLAALFTELFGTRVRYSSASLAYQIGGIVGGALAPIIATSLYAKYHSNLGVSIYMAAVCAMSLVCASRLEETRGADLVEQRGIIDHAAPAAEAS
jgi:MFS family permease